MLSIDYIRENKDKVKLAAKNKGREVDIDKTIELDDQRKALIQKIQKLREERNVNPNKEVTKDIKEKGRKIKEDIKKLESELKTYEEDLKNHLLSIPNVPLDEVPVGKDYSSNVEIKKWGELPKFNFKPKTHIELGKELDLIDFERGSKTSGYRGYFLKNELAIIHLAILFHAFIKLVSRGFTPLIPPSIVKGFALFGTGQFPWGEKEVYKLNDEDSYLQGTAEVPVTAYYSGETFNEKELPKKFVALAPSFRKEAGAYGKDTKGLYRLHEFWKVEQVILSSNNIDEAKKLHSELEKNAEEILEELDLPYRVLLMCTGEMGEPQILKYDLETWMPSRNEYGETMSNSIMGDFQTRRLNIKYKSQNNKTEFCYSLNNTLIASPRILIALLENNQLEDGSVQIPKVLHKYTGFKEIKRKE